MFAVWDLIFVTLIVCAIVGGIIEVKRMNNDDDPF